VCGVGGRRGSREIEALARGAVSLSTLAEFSEAEPLDESEESDGDLNDNDDEDDLFEVSIPCCCPSTLCCL
jgi:hypothetical protein